MTADMSHSLNVVRSAACCWASTNRSAIRCRMGLINWYRSSRLPPTRGGAEAGDFTAGGAGLTVAATASAFVTRPPGPVPATPAADTPASPSTRAAAGITLEGIPLEGITGAVGG